MAYLGPFAKPGYFMACIDPSWLHRGFPSYKRSKVEPWVSWKCTSGTILWAELPCELLTFETHLERCNGRGVVVSGDEWQKWSVVLYNVWCGTAHVVAQMHMQHQRNMENEKITRHFCFIASTNILRTFRKLVGVRSC